MTFYNLFVKLLSFFHTKNWIHKLRPANEIDNEKMKTAVFNSGTSTAANSAFVEEGLRLGEEICRNILGILKYNFTKYGLFLNEKTQFRAVEKFDISLLSTIIVQKSEQLIQILDEKTGLVYKLQDINRIPMDEINQVVKFVIGNPCEELSLNQIHQLYLTHIENRREVLKKDINVLFYSIEVSMMLLTRMWKKEMNFDPTQVIDAIERITMNESVLYI